MIEHLQRSSPSPSAPWSRCIPTALFCSHAPASASGPGCLKGGIWLRWLAHRWSGAVFVKLRNGNRSGEGACWAETSNSITVPFHLHLFSSSIRESYKPRQPCWRASRCYTVGCVWLTWGCETPDLSPICLWNFKRNVCRCGRMSFDFSSEFSALEYYRDLKASLGNLKHFTSQSPVFKNKSAWSLKMFFLSERWLARTPDSNKYTIQKVTVVQVIQKRSTLYWWRIN